MSETEGETPAAEGTNAAAAPVNVVCIATHGTLSQFDPASKDWTTYIEQVNFYFASNDVIAGAKKRSIFLASCGTATYKLARSLVEGERLSTTLYDFICTLLKDYYEPQPSIIVQRFKFNTRDRNSGESVSAYLAAHRALAEHSSYGTTKLLKEMQRGHLVCGVNHPGIQRLKSSHTGHGASERDSRNLWDASQKPNPESINTGGCRNSGGGWKKTPDHPKPDAITCYRCGGPPHLGPACKFKNAKFLYCKKKGHLARICKAKARWKQPCQPVVHYVEEEDNLEEDIFTIRDQKCSPIVIEILLNNVSVKMEVDTGTVISQATFSSEIKSTYDRRKFDWRHTRVMPSPSWAVQHYK